MIIKKYEYFRCECEAGYEMRNETCFKIDPCEKPVCGDGAVCNDLGGGEHSCTCLEGYQMQDGVCTGKRYFIVDQQIERHNVLFNECFYHPLPFYETQIINPFLSLRPSANHGKGLGF